MLRRRRFLPLAVALAGLPLLLGLAGCSGSDQASSAAGGDPAAMDRAGSVEQAAPARPGSAQDEAQAVTGDGAQAVGGAATGAGKADANNPAALVGAQLIRTADVVVQVDQLATSAARVRAVAESLGGTVSSEVTTFPDSPAPATPDLTATGGETDSAAPVRSTRPGESVIVLRVPVASLDQAIDRVTAVGTVLSRTSTSQDVTADLADVASRVKTQQASVERVRQLLSQATSLQDIVRLEAELTQRQSDLEALEARRASLADRAALSTLTVTLRTPTVAEEVDRPGFLSGLKRSWRAVISSTTVILTVLGALLPLIVLALIAGTPIVWWRRRRAHRNGHPATPPTPPSPTPPSPTPPSPTPPSPTPPSP